MLVPESSLDWTQPIPNTEVDVDELEHDGYGFVYNEEPFTGIAVSHYPDGQRESYRPCLNGFPHGFCRWWHANGRPSAEWTSYRGMGHGWATEYHESGRVRKRNYAEFSRPLDWWEFDEVGREIDRGSNMKDAFAIAWIEKYRKQFPDAP